MGEKKDLLNAIKKSLLNKYDGMIRMDVIYTIYEYSVGITVKCCNQIKSCLNEINFQSKYEMEVNAQQNDQMALCDMNELKIYQYYLHKNQKSNIIPNVVIYNKKRRIFCERCSRKELIKCILCRKQKEVRST